MQNVSTTYPDPAAPCLVSPRRDAALVYQLTVIGGRGALSRNRRP